MQQLTFHETLAALRRGDVCVFPTETLYALGCDARAARAVERVFALKGRTPGKPLPLVIGGLGQLDLVAAPGWRDSALFLGLAGRFWPGPLTVILPAREGLPAPVVGPDGGVAVRWTPHPLAGRLCREAGCALAATSANPSDAAPPWLPEQVAPALLAGAAGILALPPRPAGGPPSTLVALRGDTVLILRHGAIPEPDLQAAGFATASPT
jgi:L-threonylcarbamoyladenylate synthase